MNANFQIVMKKRYRHDSGLSLRKSLVNAGGREEIDLLSKEKGSLLYALEAEEIDLKNLGSNA